MGTWGTGILDDDFAAEIASSYLGELYNGSDSQAATDRVVAEYGALDSDEHSVFWLALAAVQFDYGRLIDAVQRNAIAVIASGNDLQKWNGNKERARVLKALHGKLNGPARPMKKLTKRPPTLLPGDIFRLPLDDGRYAFGRVLTEGERAFYRLVSNQKRPPLAEIVASEVLFVVGSTDDGFARRSWFVIGNIPLEETLRAPIYFYHRPVGSAECTLFNIWDPGRSTFKPASECVAFEQWGAWSAVHCRDRVLTTLAGQPCRWIPR